MPLAEGVVVFGRWVVEDPVVIPLSDVGDVSFLLILAKVKLGFSFSKE